MFRVILCIQFYRLMQLIFSTLFKGIIRKNANHLQTTDTLKRHQRYSIHYHCGWPSLWTWGSATHNGLPALPEPYLRACGLHNMWCSGWFYVFNFIDWRNLFFSTLSPLEIVLFATFYHLQKYLRGTCFSKKRLFQVDSTLLNWNIYWLYLERRYQNES